MQEREQNLWLNWGLLVASLVTFSTGLVLLLRFHAGEGAFASAAFGLNKLVWLNVHRLSTILVLAGVMTHVALHWRPFRGRLIRFAAGKAGRRVDSEVIMYAVFCIAALTGMVAWLVLEGASPLLGPAIIGRASSTRHPWIDTHHISSLISLLLVVHHVGHRRRFLVR